MGKKGKVGKQRKDNYYKLAKQKENSRVCIDLCAAPGGWLQVASEYMPVSSVIIGVDLVPITPIRNVITFQSDITTKQCSETLENNLASWKADVVLHDGAPNIGKNWLHDSYGQNVLVVNALKLACDHLQKGGWFITKVFRASDFNSLLWVFGKLFNKVHVTKPQASRSESAEIFVVCQGYRKPSDIDDRFFDPSSLFGEISTLDETLKKQKADLLKPANKIKKPKAVGYEEGDILKTVSDVEFLTTNTHMESLATCHQIVFTDSQIIANTSDEVKECCKDLKVLGRREILLLLKWRRDLRKDLTNKLIVKTDEEIEEVETIPELELDDLEEAEDEAKRKEVKRVKRRDEKRRKDHEQRVKYGMVNDGDVLIEEEVDLFKLPREKLDEIQDVEPDEVLEQPEEPVNNVKPRKVTFSRENDVQYFDQDEEIEQKEVDEEPKIATPKIIKNSNNNVSTLFSDPISATKITAADRFFDGGAFSGTDLETDLEMDLVDKISSSNEPRTQKKFDEPDLSRFDDESSSDEEEDERRKKRKREAIKLDPLGLAIASEFVAGSKEDLVDSAWNRYTHGDTELAPKWFREDESRFNSGPIAPEVAKLIKQKETDRPIKKVLEAKMRQKRKAMRRMDKAKKKVDAIFSNDDLTQRERINQVKAIYQKATKTKKKETKLVVSRKGLPIKKPGKGRYKTVDARQKKDIRGKKDARGGKGNGKGKGRGKPKAKGNKQKRNNKKR